MKIPSTPSSLFVRPHPIPAALPSQSAATSWISPVHRPDAVRFSGQPFPYAAVITFEVVAPDLEKNPTSPKIQTIRERFEQRLQEPQLDGRTQFRLFHDKTQEVFFESIPLFNPLVGRRLIEKGWLPIPNFPHDVIDHGVKNLTNPVAPTFQQGIIGEILSGASILNLYLAQQRELQQEHQFPNKPISQRLPVVLALFMDKLPEGVRQRSYESLARRTNEPMFLLTGAANKAYRQFLNQALETQGGQAMLQRLFRLENEFYDQVAAARRTGTLEGLQWEVKLSPDEVRFIFDGNDAMLAGMRAAAPEVGIDPEAIPPTYLQLLKTIQQQRQQQNPRSY
jgi:hypothetical protein